MNLETQLQHPPSSLNDPYKASATPIYQSATFCQDSAQAHGPYDYSRSGNPTRTALEEQLAVLTKGTRAFAFSSGMAAITTVTRLLQSGDELLACHDLYGGSFRLFSRVLTRQGITVRFVDTNDVEAVARSINEKTRMVWVETPSNPLQTITDIEALAALCQQHNVLFTVDNTFLSPYWQTPLLLGADIVVHSATKYLCGHSDTSAGVVAVHSAELAEEIGFFQNAEGNALAPMDAFLFLRGLKTLSVRLDRQQENALKLAERLNSHPEVECVYYPGLESHPGHELHVRQSRGFGAVLSVSLGSKERASQVVDATKLFKICVSFGSTTSTVSLPCTMSHASIPEEEQKKKGFPTDLIRLSVGIESVEDLWADLSQALDSLAEQSTSDSSYLSLPSSAVTVETHVSAL